MHSTPNHYIVPISNLHTMDNNIKTCVALILSATVSISAQAQFPYEGSVFTEEYVSLQDPTLLDIDLGWDDPELVVPLPFTFSIGELQAFEMNLGGTGEMLFAMGEIGSMNILWPLSLDVMDVSNAMTNDPEDVSTIGYQTEGNEPNRIFKIEWNNCGVYEEIDELGTADIRVNWQVWLHEGSGMIEYRFGPTTLTEEDLFSVLEGYPLSSAIILNLDEGYSGEIYFASGDASSPSWSMDTDFYNWYYNGESLTNVPQEGTGYRFNGTSTSSAESEVVNNAFQLFPNPASSTCVVSNLTETEQQYSCLSVAGKIVDQWMLAPQATQRLDVSEFAPGLYVIQTDQGASQKLMIH